MIKKNERMDPLVVPHPPFCMLSILFINTLINHIAKRGPAGIAEEKVYKNEIFLFVVVTDVPILTPIISMHASSSGNSNKDIKENNAETDTTKTLASPSPQHSSSTTTTATTTADQLTSRLRSLSMSSSTTSSSPAPPTLSLSNTTTHQSSYTFDKNVLLPSSSSAAAVDLMEEGHDVVGSCGIDDRKHSELGGSHESSSTSQQQQAKSNITTEKKQRLYKTELCRNWEELQICR